MNWQDREARNRERISRRRGRGRKSYLGGADTCLPRHAQVWNADDLEGDPYLFLNKHLKNTKVYLKFLCCILEMGDWRFKEDAFCFLVVEGSLPKLKSLLVVRLTYFFLLWMPDESFLKLQCKKEVDFWIALSLAYGKRQDWRPLYYWVSSALFLWKDWILSFCLLGCFRMGGSAHVSDVIWFHFSLILSLIQSFARW